MTEVLKLQAEQEPELEEDSPYSTASYKCCGGAEIDPSA
jgi:hypothetical protein